MSWDWWKNIFPTPLNLPVKSRQSLSHSTCRAKTNLSGWLAVLAVQQSLCSALTERFLNTVFESKVSWQKSGRREGQSSKVVKGKVADTLSLNQWREIAVSWKLSFQIKPHLQPKNGFVWPERVLGHFSGPYRWFQRNTFQPSFINQRHFQFNNRVVVCHLDIIFRQQWKNMTYFFLIPRWSTGVSFRFRPLPLITCVESQQATQYFIIRALSYHVITTSANIFSMQSPRVAYSKTTITFHHRLCCHAFSICFKWYSWCHTAWGSNQRIFVMCAEFNR